MGGCCPPIPSHPPRARGSPQHCEGFFSLQMGFSERDFRAGASRDWPRSSLCRNDAPQSRGASPPRASLVGPCWDVPPGSWHLQGRGVKQPTLGHGSRPPHGSFQAFAGKSEAEGVGTVVAAPPSCPPTASGSGPRSPPSPLLPWLPVAQLSR